MLSCIRILALGGHNHIFSSFLLVLILMIGSETLKYGSKVVCDQEKTDKRSWKGEMKKYKVK